MAQTLRTPPTTASAPTRLAGRRRPARRAGRSGVGSPDLQLSTAARRMAVTDDRGDRAPRLWRRWRPRSSRRGSVTRGRRPPARTDGSARSRGPGSATVGANWHMCPGRFDDGQRPHQTGWTSSAGPQGREEPRRLANLQPTTAVRRMAFPDRRGDRARRLGRRRSMGETRPECHPGSAPTGTTDGPARSRGPGSATVGANWHMRPGRFDDGQRPHKTGWTSPAGRRGREGWRPARIRRVATEVRAGATDEYPTPRRIPSAVRRSMRARVTPSRRAGHGDASPAAQALPHRRPESRSPVAASAPTGRWALPAGDHAPAGRRGRRWSPARVSRRSSARSPP
jgi:hypothetical protein